jgi:hypothetical protein
MNADPHRQQVRAPRGRTRDGTRAARGRTSCGWARAGDRQNERRRRMPAHPPTPSRRGPRAAAPSTDTRRGQSRPPRRSRRFRPWPAQLEHRSAHEPSSPTTSPNDHRCKPPSPAASDRGQPPRPRHHNLIQRSGFEIKSIERIMFAASRLEPSVPPHPRHRAADLITQPSDSCRPASHRRCWSHRPSRRLIEPLNLFPSNSGCPPTVAPTLCRSAMAERQWRSQSSLLEYRLPASRRRASTDRRTGSLGRARNLFPFGRHRAVRVWAAMRWPLRLGGCCTNHSRFQSINSAAE